MDVSNRFGNRMDKDVSQICAEVLHTSNSSPQELGDSFRNHRPYLQVLDFLFQIGNEAMEVEGYFKLTCSDFFADEVGGDSGYTESRTHSMNEQRWHSTSELLYCYTQCLYYMRSMRNRLIRFQRKQ